MQDDIEDEMMALGLEGRNLIRLPGKKLVVEDGAYVNPFAIVIGEVHIHSGASLWPGVIVRADEASVEIHEGAVLLDKCFIEAPEGKDVVIGPGALISHGAIIHGARIGNGALVGIGAIVLDGAVVEDGAIVGAGAVVPPGTTIHSRMLALGIPAKEVRPLSKEEVEKTADEVRRVQKKAREYGIYYMVKRGL